LDGRSIARELGLNAAQRPLRPASAHRRGGLLRRRLGPAREV